MFRCCVAPDASAAVVVERVGSLRAVRTAKESPVGSQEALEMLKAGNQRYLAQENSCSPVSSRLRTMLADNGQNPFAVVIGCADSRCPLEILFDAAPGDLFVLRNAGNACPHREGSIVASTEYAVGALHTKLIVVLGHTKCGAITDATLAWLAATNHGEDGAVSPNNSGSATPLQQYLKDLAPAAKIAADALPKGTPEQEVILHAIKSNIFNTMQKVLDYSADIREKVCMGEVEIHGALYDITSGEVQWLGQHPKAKEIMAEASSFLT